MALEAQSYRVEIAATPFDCFKVVTDFASYPKWSSPIESVKVIEKDKAGIGRRVEFHIDMRFKTVRYVLEYQYRRSSELTWRSIDGDIEAIEGAYHFRKLSPKLTEATCRQAIELGFWVPGPLRRLAERNALRQSVEEFKTEVERRKGR